MVVPRRCCIGLALLFSALASGCGAEGRELERLLKSANAEYGNLKVIANDLERFRAQHRLLVVLPRGATLRPGPGPALTARCLTSGAQLA